MNQFKIYNWEFFIQITDEIWYLIYLYDNNTKNVIGCFENIKSLEIIKNELNNKSKKYVKDWISKNIKLI